VNLDDLAKAARMTDSRWESPRAARVLASTLGERKRRVARSRALQRSFAIASASAVLLVVLLRGGSAPASTGSDSVEAASAPSAALAVRDSDGDGGYGRD
jgi:hypothetical protein